MKDQVIKRGRKWVNGISIHSCRKEFVLEVIDNNIKNERSKNHICITNTESMYYAEQIPEHLEYINSATFSLCDGIGSVIAGKFQGADIKRFNGPDFLLEACDYGQDKGWRHYFCGGKEGVADKLVENLKDRYPQIQIAGTFCPPFRKQSKEEKDAMIEAINESRPDILWVGLGLLKQEAWIAEFKEKLEVPWSVGVGAAFDFYAGTVKRAPKVIRKSGFEWLYRLSKERRMFIRNVNSYKFMNRAMIKGIKDKLKLEENK